MKQGGRPHDAKVAVALAYGDGPAPPVVAASGREELAEAILAEARRQGVFVAEDKYLAEALARLEMDQPVPEELFTAVAVLLSWSYWLRGLSPGGGSEVS